MRSLLLLVLVARTAAANPDCTCANLKEIQYRMKEIQVLIANYKAEIANLGANGPKFTNSAYNLFEQSQQQALDQLKASTPGSPHTSGGSTDPASCMSHFPTGLSACLLDALKAHEGHHATVCRTVNPGPITDYRSSATLAAAYQEEIASYYLELDVLTQAFRDLPASCKPKEWYLKWTVAIDGKSSPSSKIAWKVHHEYTGTAELSDLGTQPRPASFAGLTPQKARAMTPAQLQALMNGSSMHVWAINSASYVPIDVEIDDTMKWKSHDRGEADSFEDTLKDQSWKTKGAVHETAQNQYRLEVDEKANTYNIHIPFYSMGTTPSVAFLDTTEINRSAVGWGNKPTHEGPTTVPKQLPASTFIAPPVASVFLNGMVHHDKDLTFAPKEDMVTFDSGNLTMDASSSYLSNLPGVKDNLKIHVTYTLSKLPI